MASDHLTLGFDTSAAHCAAALLSGNLVLATRSEEMSRGQAEHLMPMIEEMLGAQGFGWSDVNRVGVGIGPGNFSGIRISVSAARGLALSLDVPAIGVSTFQATALTAPKDCIPAVPAPQNKVYIAPEGHEPHLIPLSDDPQLAMPPDPETLVTNIARIAAIKDAPFARPAPLYIRAADAAPPRDAPPVILDDDS